MLHFNSFNCACFCTLGFLNRIHCFLSRQSGIILDFIEVTVHVIVNFKLFRLFWFGRTELRVNRIKIGVKIACLFQLLKPSLLRFFCARTLLSCEPRAGRLRPGFKTSLGTWRLVGIMVHLVGYWTLLFRRNHSILFEVIRGGNGVCPNFVNVHLFRLSPVLFGAVVGS